jgi:hypothetical protein
MNTNFKLSHLLLALGLAYATPTLATPNRTAPDQAASNLSQVTAPSTTTRVSAVITAPTTTEVFQEPATVTIRVATVDQTRGRNNQKVTFFSGGTRIGEEIRFRNTNDTFFFKWTGVAAGTYTLTAQFTASNGSVTTTAPVTLTVGAPVPTPPGPAVATFYQDCAFGGAAVALAPGSYNRAELAARGLAGTISSFQVDPAYKVELYTQEDFMGARAVLQGDQACLAGATNGYNDLTQALRIAPVSQSSLAPLVYLTGPAANAVFVAPATVKLGVFVSGREAILDKVEFYSGSTLIGAIPGLISGEGFPQFLFFDWTGVAAGTYTVTAKVYAFNGLSTVSTPITVQVGGAASARSATENQVSATNDFALVANTATNSLQVLSDAPTKISAISLYYFSGRPAKFATGAAAEHLDISALPDGLYFAVVQDSNGVTRKKKVLIQR